jgi:nicotinate (nicotinamide) nucleotide adenylyltransferase
LRTIAANLYNVQIVDPFDVDAGSIVVVPGAFNPPTRAHVMLAEAALTAADAVLFALPGTLPHKEFTGASLEQRVEMLRRITASSGRLASAVADGGLYIDIAREVRERFPHAEIKLLCGRDAAERIVSWKYDEPGVVERLLSEFELLVAARKGSYDPPPHLRSRIRTLDTPNLDEYSSTRVKAMLREGGDWRSLTPVEIADMLEQIYKLEA